MEADKEGLDIGDDDTRLLNCTLMNGCNDKHHDVYIFPQMKHCPTDLSREVLS